MTLNVPTELIWRTRLKDSSGCGPLLDSVFTAIPMPAQLTAAFAAPPNCASPASSTAAGSGAVAALDVEHYLAALLEDATDPLPDEPVDVPSEALA